MSNSTTAGLVTWMILSPVLVLESGGASARNMLGADRFLAAGCVYERGPALFRDLRRHRTESGTREGTMTLDNRRTYGPLPAGEADYVIVGLGTAGAPLAALLSKDLKTSVLVIE